MPAGEEAIYSGVDLSAIFQIECDRRGATACLYELVDYCFRPVHATVGVDNYFNPCRGEGSANGLANFAAAACHQARRVEETDRPSLQRALRKCDHQSSARDWCRIARDFKAI